jgi:hypothetical protein
VLPSAKCKLKTDGKKTARGPRLKRHSTQSKAPFAPGEESFRGDPADFHRSASFQRQVLSNIDLRMECVNKKCTSERIICIVYHTRPNIQNAGLGYLGYSRARLCVHWKTKWRIGARFHRCLQFETEKNKLHVSDRRKSIKVL